MSYFMIYIFLMLDNIKGALLCFNGVVYFYVGTWITSAFITLMASIPDIEDIMTEFWKIFKNFKILHIIVATLFIFFSTIQIMLPTTKQMALIYVVPKVVNNENLQKVPDNVLQLINGYLEELTDDIVETKDEVVNKIKDGKKQLGKEISIEKDQLISDIKDKTSEILKD